jgi:hypothetical protein
MLGRFQHLGPWLFCLYLIAQIGGVTPLVYVDVLHEYGHHDAIDQVESVAVNPAQSQPHHQHNPGMHDEHDQCCALHHGLIGTLPQTSDHVAKVDVAPVFELARTTLVSTATSRLDRPPRA